jgi:hypothetical protein
VYGGEKDADRPLPAGVTRQKTNLTNTDPLFDPNNTMTNHVLLIVTFQGLSAKHGPSAVVAHLRKQFPEMSAADATAWVREWGMPDGCPCDLSGLVGFLIVDEAQMTKSYMAHSSMSIRWLRALFIILLTATPVPWNSSGFGGLLAFIQDTELNAEALELLRKDDLANPYDQDADPSIIKYACTYAAFSHYCLDTLSLAEQGRILAIVWDKVLLRRTYRASCVTHPNGDVHTLVNLLPSSLPVRYVYSISIGSSGKF